MSESKPPRPPNTNPKNIDFKINGVCLVGAGHATHASIAIFKTRGIEHVNVFSNFDNEIQRFKDGLESNGGLIEAAFADHLLPSGIVKASPACVTDDAELAMKGVSVIVLPVPSFAYENIFVALKPYIKPGMVICVTPGQGGVHWYAQSIFGKELFDSLTFFSLCPMPFNCRVKDFGKRVDVQAFKTEYMVFTSPADAGSIAISVSKQLYGGDVADCGHIISASLMPLNPNIHPQRLYSMLRDYKEGDILEDNPLFYEEMTEEATMLMTATSNELRDVLEALRKHGIIPCNKVPNIMESERLTWPNVTGAGECPKRLVDIFRMNPNYKGFRCPFKAVDGGWIPDFSNRYFTEDIPLGLCIYKGIASLVDVETPTIDKLIKWAQRHMKKQYLNDSTASLTGADVTETAAPQRFGIDTVEQLLYSTSSNITTSSTC